MRKVKDPNAPTKPKSAYLLFLLDKNEEIKKSGKYEKGMHNVAEVTKLIGAMWQQISPEERKLYDERARKEKDRYEEEMREYAQSDNAKHFQKSQQSRPSTAPAKSSSSFVKQKPQHHQTAQKAKPVAFKYSQSPKKARSVSPEISPPKTKPHSSHVHHTPVEIPNLESGNFEELQIPIFNQDFLDWHSSREKDLRKIRQQANDVEEDTEALRYQAEKATQLKNETEEARITLEQVRNAKKEITAILLEEFAGFKLPDGITIDEDNVEYFMGQLERFSNKASWPEADSIQAKLKAVAPRIEHFMSFL